MENLKNLRIEAGMSQTELSMRANVARWKLSMTENGQLLENGRCPLRPSEQTAVLEALRNAFRRTAEKAQARSNMLSEPLVAAG
jgi:transcriptional regulator with XRE-family HTH domain